MASVLVDEILVRPLTSNDLSKIRELHSKILPIQYPTSFFLQLLLLPTRACFVAYRRPHPNIPIGFISAAIQQPVPSRQCCNVEFSEDQLRVRRDKNFPRLEILTLGVLPQYQKRGLARRLVQRMLDNLHESWNTNFLDGTLVYANVSTCNIEALKFYERMGMVISSEVIRNLYRTLSGCKDGYVVVGVL